MVPMRVVGTLWLSMILPLMILPLFSVFHDFASPRSFASLRFSPLASFNLFNSFNFGCGFSALCSSVIEDFWLQLRCVASLEFFRLRLQPHSLTSFEAIQRLFSPRSFASLRFSPLASFNLFNSFNFGCGFSALCSSVIEDFWLQLRCVASLEFFRLRLQ